MTEHPGNDPFQNYELEPEAVLGMRTFEDVMFTQGTATPVNVLTGETPLHSQATVEEARTFAASPDSASTTDGCRLHVCPTERCFRAGETTVTAMVVSEPWPDAPYECGSYGTAFDSPQAHALHCWEAHPWVPNPEQVRFQRPDTE